MYLYEQYYKRLIYLDLLHKIFDTYECFSPDEIMEMRKMHLDRDLNWGFGRDFDAVVQKIEVLILFS